MSDNLDLLRMIIASQSQQSQDISSTNQSVTLHSPDSLLGMKWMFTEARPEDEESWKQYAMLTQPYQSPALEVPEEVTEMKIDKRDFKYEGYYNCYGGGMISEDEARENMTDYYYRNWDPLIFRKVTKHYYMAGPDADSAPTKRKFYNALGWYRDFYDGRHGQKTDIEVDEVDLNEWDELIVGMVVSGDFSLKEAMYAVAIACDRCRHALLWKYREYHTREDGYSDDSKEFKKNNSRCQFCRYY